MSDSDEILVIGAGLGRTGTNSLKIALEHIYGKPCYHLKEIYMHRHKDVAKWVELERSLAESPDGAINEKMVKEIYAGYAAAIDHPTCVFYKQLIRLYPNAKVILTTRDPEIWLAGCRSTILPRKANAHRTWSFLFLRWLIGLKPLHEMYLNSWRRVFGEHADFSDDTVLLSGFIAWSEQVKAAVPADRLLVFDISQGWGPLCRFLNRPVPDIDFPYVNEYRELRRLIRLERKVTNFLQYGLPVLMLIGLAYLLRHMFR